MVFLGPKCFLSIKDYFFIKPLRGLRGTPFLSSVLMGFSSINHSFLGTPMTWESPRYAPSGLFLLTTAGYVFFMALCTIQGFLCKCRHGGSFSSISFFGIWIDVHELYQWKLYGYVYGKPFRKPYLEVQFQL